ncbi:MAG: DUF692 domain-containing protein [Myxococcales bacterium]|nr:DUF692 domain-containing protein [Myxococcales bacterium]
MRPFSGFGLGLRREHYPDFLSGEAEVDFVEVISENFMVDGGRPLAVLEQVRTHYPVILHGVSLSVGSADGVDREYLARLRALADRIEPLWVSDHLCWTRTSAHNSHDLLPLPYTREVLEHVVERCKRIAGELPVPFALENPSTYVGWQASAMPEQDFLAELLERADIGLLLDVNNVFVSACNHGTDPRAWLAAIPGDRVVQVHLAGHSIREGYRLDTHDAPVCDEVWQLYRELIERIGPVPTLIEWDDELPSWERLAEEAASARRVRDEATAVWRARGA